MIGIIVVSHGNLALELKSAMEHILGVQKNIGILLGSILYIPGIQVIVIKNL